MSSEVGFRPSRRAQQVAPNLACSGILFALILAAPAAGQEQVAPIASHTVTSQRRTLTKLPSKGLITTAEAFERVTRFLADAPPPPRFEEGQRVALVVADVSGEAKSWITGMRRRGEGQLEVELTRVEAAKASVDPSLKAFFLVVPDEFIGVHLVHKTVLLDDAGVIQRGFPALPSDVDPRQLPRLGADMRFTVSMADGSAVPEGIQLRYEVLYPSSEERPGRALSTAFPAAGLCFPRVRDDVRHVYAAFAEGLRSKNPFVLTKLPRRGADGSPLPIKHRFLLEPVPE